MLRDGQTILQFRGIHNFLGHVRKKTNIVDGLIDETSFQEFVEVYIKNFNPQYSMVGNFLVTKINGIETAFNIKGVEEVKNTRALKLTCTERTSLHDWVEVISADEYDRG